MEDTIFIISTGLGVVNRGFESYTSSLADKMIENNYKVTVLSGGYFTSQEFTTKRIRCINRSNKFIVRFLTPSQCYKVELYSFFISLMPIILLKKPNLIYLGEYTVYCLLFKLRKLFKLNFKLVLYTGGQATAYLFDNNSDYVHHITDVYFEQTVNLGMAKENQFIVPHFINDDFSINEIEAGEVFKQAKGKRIVLSVGLLDNATKRMGELVDILSFHSNRFFPILLGDSSPETPQIRQKLLAVFGEEGFIMKKVNHAELGTYYNIADLFMLCSRKESFGLAYLEALYFGKPVICHDFYESRYVLKEMGYFIDFDNLHLRHLDLEMILCNDNEGFREYRKKYATSYLWDSMKSQYLKMFDHILDAKKNRHTI